MAINKILPESVVEEREYNDRLRNALICFIDILEQLSMTCNQNLISPLEKFSKFTITVSNNSLITCHADFSNQSLKVINECDSNLVQQHRILSCPQKKNKEWSLDKAIQSNSSLSTSKFVQTQIYVDTRGIKLQLLRQIRTLKQDVVILRELVFHFDCYQPLAHSIIYDKMAEIGYNKLIEANKARARNFVRFYKLRKSKRKKNSLGGSSGQLVSIDVI